MATKVCQDVVFYKGVLYRTNKMHLNAINWRSSKTGCKGRLVTKVLFWNQRDSQTLLSQPSTNPAEAKGQMIENRKTAVSTTRDIPRRKVQRAVVAATKEAMAALNSVANLRHIVLDENRK